MWWWRRHGQLASRLIDGLLLYYWCCGAGARGGVAHLRHGGAGGAGGGLVSWTADWLMDCCCIIDAVVQVPGAEWHTYDMEVQVVLEAAWSAGQQTVDISLHFPGCPYIMNFCNLTQVRKTSGFVRWVREYSVFWTPLLRLFLHFELLQSHIWSFFYGWLIRVGCMSVTKVLLYHCNLQEKRKYRYWS